MIVCYQCHSRNLLYSVSFEIGLGSIDNGHGVFTHAAITRTHMRGAAGAAAT